MEDQDKKLTLEEQELVTGGAGSIKESRKKCPICGKIIMSSKWSAHQQLHEQKSE